MENTVTVQTDTVDVAERDRKRQFNKNKWLFSVGGIGRDMSYQLISAFLLTYVQFGVSLSLIQFTTLSLIIGVGGSIWDAVNDPMMGAIIEGTHMKWGKFKPWILIGALTCGVIIICIFNIRIWTGWNFVVYMIVMFLLWESTFTMNDIGYWAMLPSLSSKKAERNSVTALTVIFAGIGAFLGQGIVIFFTPGDVVHGYGMVSIIIACAFIGCQIMTAFGVKETARPKGEKENKISFKHMVKTIVRNDQILWMTLSMLLYSIGSNLLVALAYNLYYLEIGYNSNCFYFIVIFGVCNVGVNMLYPKFAKKFGRKKLQLYSILLAILGYIGIALLGWWPAVLPFNLLTLSIFGVLVFSGQTMFYLASIINMTNCVEYNEYKQGERNEAVVSTLRPFMTKIASAVQYGVVTLVLALSGIFILSQNISLMESQKNYLTNIEQTSQQVQYIETVKDYLDIYNSTEDKTEAVELIAEELSEDEFMTGYQLRAEYVESLADCKLYRTAYQNGAFVETVDLGYWKDLNVSDLLSDSGDTTYEYSMELLGNGFNAANENFKNHSSTAMRLWIRTAVSVVPILLLLGAWYVQRKKFIIDEEYYDKMTKEIEDRHQNDAETE